MKEMTKTTWISIFFALLFAVGTYAWKYSSYYARHGIVLFLSSLILLSLWRIMENRGGVRWRILLFGSLAFSFTIDTVFFTAGTIILGSPGTRVPLL